MHKIKTISLRTAVVTAVLLFGASVPVYAQDGGGSGIEHNGMVKTAETDHPVGTTPPKGTEAPETHNMSDNGTNSDLHKQKEAELEQLREKHQGTKNDAEHQHKCEAHKQGLTTKFDRIVKNSQRMQTRIDDILAKAQAYKESNDLQPADYDNLLATAQTAQATSKASIEALQSVKPTIDCNSTSTASDVATFRAAAKTTRDNLKAYRAAVKALIQAIIAAKPDNQGGNQ